MEVTYFKSIHKSQEPDERPALKSLSPRVATLGEWEPASSQQESFQVAHPLASNQDPWYPTR